MTLAQQALSQLAPSSAMAMLLSLAAQDMTKMLLGLRVQDMCGQAVALIAIQARSWSRRGFRRLSRVRPNQMTFTTMMLMVVGNR